ncbi:hypothetical protein MKW92_010468 [Papaver armeniacum]|nr:hypothetical protein MKW92_010468 [Papaver armeniacum]
MEKKATGNILMHKYEVGRFLGQGTFAKVYHGRNLKTGQSVAIKTIYKEKILRVGMIDQTKREISVMRLVRHPNVVWLLFDKILKGGKLKEDVARNYFQQLVSAIDYCHSRRVYHRDLKPENLLLDENENLKISDFGLSALWDSRRQDGLLHTTCGTPAYVAPEVIHKKGYDGAKADIWSSGVILFVLLAGYLPFQDSNIMEMYKKIFFFFLNTKDEKFIKTRRGLHRFIPLGILLKWDFKLFKPEVRKLLLKILDPNPHSRITVEKIMENSWFSKGFKPIESHLETPKQNRVPSFGDINEAFRHGTSSCDEEESSEERHSMKPTCLNAFDIISLSAGFNLSPLFEKETDQRSESRFTTTKPASTIVSKLEEIAETERFKVMKKDGGMVKLEGNKSGRKGHLAIDAEIFEVTPSLFFVELRPCPKDILWIPQPQGGPQQQPQPAPV